MLRTERLHLRRWRTEDAAALLPILAANADHLRAWIPESVWAPVPLPELSERLTRYSADFDAQRAWRYAIFSSDERALLGEASLFPRNPAARVAFPNADRLEIGYWLRADATGSGYATEATRALLELASTLPGVNRVEIRCDSRNAASAAIPRRLGFRLASADASSTGDVATDPYGMIWYCPLASASSELG